MTNMKKLQQLCCEDLTKPQDFFKTCNLDQCRMAMRLKCGMLDIAGDMPRRYAGSEGCVGCDPVVRGEEGPAEKETREHLELCPGYTHLWGPRLDNTEIINYFLRLMKTRAENRKKVRQKD